MSTSFSVLDNPSRSIIASNVLSSILALLESESGMIFLQAQLLSDYIKSLHRLFQLTPLTKATKKAEFPRLINYLFQ